MLFEEKKEKVSLIQIRVKEFEKEKLKKIAQSKNMTITELIKNSLNAYLK